jgi:RimJ/RimL family protein N-acetyltransferase
VELRTSRIRLRPFREADATAFASFCDTDGYRRYLDDNHPDAAKLVTNNVGVDGAWVVELDGSVVGSVFLGDELACLLDPAVHRLGIGTEAARAVIDDGFGRRGYTEVVARADDENIASLRGLQRLGFTRRADGTYRLRRADWEVH